jgi:sulfur-oxidizing protein SoxA
MMRGVAARYPAYDPALDRVLTLEARIQHCRMEHQHAPPLAPESDALLALAALVGLQSRGLPLHVDTDGPAHRAYEDGELLFRLRQGQLSLSCANCHDMLAGQRLGGAVIPQGHPNGYPIYRLEWQGMGSLERRIRSCTAGVRAEPIEGDDFAALTLYLAKRADGLEIETPAVRP